MRALVGLEGLDSDTPEEAERLKKAEEAATTSTVLGCAFFGFLVYMVFRALLASADR